MRCAHCGLENIDAFVAEGFDGWNWVYICGPGHIRECRERARAILAGDPHNSKSRQIPLVQALNGKKEPI